jgi:hypothetical protein
VRLGPRPHGARRRVAATLHERWCEQRDYKPRVKLVDGNEFDIANLEFDDLPPKFQTAIWPILCSHRPKFAISPKRNAIACSTSKPNRCLA